MQGFVNLYDNPDLFLFKINEHWKKEEIMKVIKRNGSEVVFDISKIITAITKGNSMGMP